MHSEQVTWSHPRTTSLKTFDFIMIFILLLIETKRIEPFF